MNHPSEEQLLLYYYGEGADRDEVTRHLEACAACRARDQAIRRVLTAVNRLPVPGRGEGYGAEIWRQVRPQILRGTPSPRGPFRWLLRSPGLALAGALAALLLGAFLAGRFWSGHAPGAGPGTGSAQAPQPLPTGARERVLLSEIADHLERSQRALVELINSRTNGPVDIAGEQVLARELAAVNRLFRRTAIDAGEPGMASVLEELEVVLIEISNGPARLSADEFAALRQRLDADGLLFKVKVLNAQMRAREQESVRERAGLKS